MVTEEFKYLTVFGILEFTTAELQQLRETEQQFLLAASLITNDIRFHWSLMARSNLDSESEDVKVMQIVRDFWTLRKLSSVVYEAEKSLKTFASKIPSLKALVDAGTALIPDTPNSGNYLDLAHKLRNRSSYHYGVGDLAKNINGFDADAKHIYYAHEQQGNSISSLCEQIITLPTITSAFDGADVEGFHAWCRDSSSAILKFCNIAIANIIRQNFPKKEIIERQLVLGDEAAPPLHRWPLCLVVEKKAPSSHE